MPNTSQGFKRDRQNLRRRARNRMLRSRLRTSVRRVRDSVESGAGSEATTKLYRDMASLADGAMRKGIIHGNKAARLKRRLNKAMRQASG